MNNLDYKGKQIYLGLDVHKSSWELRVLTEHTTQKLIHFNPPKVEVLEKYLKVQYPGADYLCAYEAGFSGFWIQEKLEKRGIKTIVFHAADIPTTDKEKRFKTDKIDCTKIAKALRAGYLQGIYIPSKAQQLARSIVRQRYRCISDLQRVRNRIKGHLHFYGLNVEYPKGVNESRWSNRMLNCIEEFAEQIAHPALLGEIALLRCLRQAETAAMKRIRALSKSHYAAPTEWLTSIKGIGLITAMVVLVELGPIDRFKSLDHLAAYVGIVPGSHSSAEVEKSNRICRRGNKRLRTALILSAWLAVRNDPQMAEYYENCRQRMIAQKAIIKVARKLLSRIRFVLLNECNLQYDS